MDEIGATFADAGLPDDLQIGAKEIYERLAHFKDADPAPSIDDILAALEHGRQGDYWRKGDALYDLKASEGSRQHISGVGAEGLGFWLVPSFLA